MITITASTTSTLMTLIPRDADQRLEWLRYANEIRVARARMKKDIRGGKFTVVDILRDVPPYAMTMKVYDLLLTKPHVGEVKVKNIMKRLQLHEGKRLRGLSHRQLNELINALS